MLSLFLFGGLGANTICLVRITTQQLPIFDGLCASRLHLRVGLVRPRRHGSEGPLLLVLLLLVLLLYVVARRDGEQGKLKSGQGKSHPNSKLRFRFKNLPAGETMAFNGANDDSEWVVVSNETWSPKRTAEENLCVWFEPQSSSIIRADYFVPDPPPANEENKEQTEVVGGGGLELVCRNSFSVVNPGPGATLSALQFDDITVRVPPGLKIGHDFADFVDKRCDVWLPQNLNRDVKPPSEEKPAPCASDFPYGSSEDETNNLEKNVVNDKEETKSEVIAKNPDSNESSQKADVLVQNKGSEVCNNSGGPFSPFHPMAALCSFGMAAAAMGIVAIAKCFCRGGAPHTNNRVARSDMLGFHPQILRFDVCSEHQKIRELMLHSSRVSKGFFTSARGGAVPVSYHLSVGNSFDAI